MPSCRPRSGTRRGRLVLALAAMLIAGSNSRLEGDDTPATEPGATVEVNGEHRPRSRTKRAEVKVDLGDNKDGVTSLRSRKKNVVEINLADSKDARVEVVREHYADVEINGYRVKPRLKAGRRYL